MLDKILAKIPKINEKNRHYILGVGLLLIFLLYYFLLMKPQLDVLIRISPKIDIMAKDLKQARIDVSMVGEHKARTEELRKRMEATGDRILSKEEIPRILDSISRLAAESGVKINQIMPLSDSQEVVLPPSGEGKYFSLPILITARGGYHGIGRFLDKIETNQIFMSTVDFDIAATNDESMQHSEKITIKAFVIDRPENIEGEGAKTKK